MDLVPMDDVRSKSNSIYSTLQILAEHDIASSTPRKAARKTVPRDEWEAMVTALASMNNSPTIQAAHEIDLVQAANYRDTYDKILLLVNHAEDESQIFGLDEVKDTLTRRGVGQALNLSRRTATFCHRDVGLQPELFVVGASRKVLQTTYLSFPYETPQHSIRGTPWICHPCASMSTPSRDVLTSGDDAAIPCASMAELQREFAGIDCSLCAALQDGPSETSTKTEQIQKALDLLDWLQARSERVIVGTGRRRMAWRMGCEVCVRRLG
jgi:hypothetical protein